MSRRETNRQARSLVAMMRELPGGPLTRVDVLDSLEGQSRNREERYVIARAREIVRSGR